MATTTDQFFFSSKVKLAFLLLAILLMMLVVTIPFAIYLLARRVSAKVAFDAHGFDATGLGRKTRWTYAELERLGTLSIAVQGGFGHAVNGGNPSVNLCARTKAGKNLKFMISRFDRYDTMLDRITRESGLTLESVGMGAFGAKWPEPAASSVAR